MSIDRYIKKLALFLLPLLLLFGGLEYWLRKLPNTYEVKRDYFEKQLSKTETLVLGNSQPYHAIDPALFSSPCYNLSMVAQSIYYDEQLLLKYIDQMPNLKTVVIPVAYHSIDYKMSGTVQEWREYYYWHFWDIKTKDMPMYSLKQYSLLALYTPTEAIKFLTMSSAGRLSNLPLPNGFLKSGNEAVNPENFTDAEGRAIAERYEDIIKLNSPDLKARQQENIQSLQTILTVLKQRNIKPVFITIPVSTVYGKYCRQEVLEYNRGVLAQLSQQYNCNVLDYYNDSTFTLKHFVDAEHMNALGAEKLSRMLDADLRALQ